MIYGERVRLRAPERGDLQQFVDWLNDPEVRDGLLLHLPMSLAEEEQWFEGMIKRPAAEHPMVIEIQQDEEWRMIGNCGVHEIDWRCRSGMVGIFIGEKHLWNQGYGTEVMTLLLKHGFETLNLNRIWLDVYADNPRAIRSYEKVGFVLEGKKRQAMYKQGQYVDLHLMSVLREEWIARQFTGA
jgi:RimJ/RimL family protein N-acetyltransferase